MQPSLIRLAAGVLGLSACALAAAAIAQDRTAASGAAAAQADDGVVITPRKSQAVEDSKARGAKAAPDAPAKVEGEVDWQEVQRALDETQAADARVGREMRALELSRALTAEEREKMRPRGLRAMSAGQYKNVSPTEVRETRVPVLAPMTYETAGPMRVAARRNSFTAFCDLPNGAYMEVIGTRMRVVGGGPATIAMRTKARSAGAMPRLAALNAPYEISHHEQGVDLSFSRFNVAYQISVLCDDPANDVRCTGDDYVKSLADNLMLLNQEEGAGR